MANPANFIDFCDNKDKYDSLKEDETKLDAMFVRTEFGRQTLEIVRNTIMEAGLIMEEESKEEQLETDIGSGMESHERVR